MSTSRNHRQLSLPPAPLERVETGAEVEAKADLNPVEMTLEQAKNHVGRAVTKALKRTGRHLKELGDKGAVGRWCAGTENPGLARIFQLDDVRRAFIVALAEESGQAVVSTHIAIVDIQPRMAKASLPYAGVERRRA